MALDETPFTRWLWDQVRRRPDLSQTALASEIGVSGSMLSGWLSGKQIPSRKSERKLAEYFGVSLAEVHDLLVKSMPLDLSEVSPGRLVIDDNPEMVRDIATWIGYLLPLSPAQRREVLEIARERNQRGNRQDGPAQ